jgi:hypothetical protein
MTLASPRLSVCRDREMRTRRRLRADVATGRMRVTRRSREARSTGRAHRLIVATLRFDTDLAQALRRLAGMKRSRFVQTLGAAALVAAFVPSVACADEAKPKHRPERRSTAAVAIGVTSLAVGGASAVVGALMIVAAQPDPLGLSQLSCSTRGIGTAFGPPAGDSPPPCGQAQEDTQLRDAGIGALVGGLGAAVLVGMPLTIWGAGHDSAPVGAPAISVGPGSVHLSWSF